jgi:cellulose synthase/poly-beta-1,6-N-acetylglucosamine synthase-like glycosyltransferase
MINYGEFEIIVIDKEKGGKADALNAGINLARYPLLCSIGGDSIIEDNSLRLPPGYPSGSGLPLIPC